MFCHSRHAYIICKIRKLVSAEFDAFAADPSLDKGWLVHNSSATHPMHTCGSADTPDLLCVEGIGYGDIIAASDQTGTMCLLKGAVDAAPLRLHIRQPQSGFRSVGKCPDGLLQDLHVAVMTAQLLLKLRFRYIGFLLEARHSVVV